MQKEEEGLREVLRKSRRCVRKSKQDSHRGAESIERTLLSD